MQRAANEVMQSILFSAVLDAVAALKSASGGLPNQLLRDVQAIHPNVTFADLPKELQDAIAEQHARGVHPASEGRLCGRPAPADAGDSGRWTAFPSATAAAPNDRRTVRHGQGRRGPPRPEGDGPGRGPAPAARGGPIAPAQAAEGQAAAELI